MKFLIITLVSFMLMLFSISTWAFAVQPVKDTVSIFNSLDTPLVLQVLTQEANCRDVVNYSKTYAFLMATTNLRLNAILDTLIIRNALASRNSISQEGTHQTDRTVLSLFLTDSSLSPQF